MDLASQTQRNVVKRAYGSTMNGSTAPYHPSLGHAFSSTPNKFPSLGTVVAGDKQRILAGIGNAPEMVDSGLDYTDLSGAAGKLVRRNRVAQMGADGIGLGVVIGGLLIFASLDFPFARPIIDKGKEIFDQPKPLLQGIGLVAGTALVANGLGGA